MIKPNIEDCYNLFYKDDYYPNNGFTIHKKFPDKYKVYDEACYDKITDYILIGPDKFLWRVTFTYNSWGDDQFQIDGPVNEYQVIHYEYLTNEEALALESRIIAW